VETPGNTIKTVRAVNRALDLLEALAGASQGISLSNLCAMVDLNSSTSHRLLTTLALRGFVRQEATTKRYYLGIQSISIGQAAQSQFDIRSIGDDVLRKLAFEARELANMVLLNRSEAVYIDQIQAENRTIQMFTQLGVGVPLYCSAVGKAMLAFMPDDEVEKRIGSDPLQSYTANTIINRLKFREELLLTRQRGYAVDNEEREMGVRCIAAPIFENPHKILAAVSVSGPAGRFTQERENELSKLVMKASAEISARLGFRGEFSSQGPNKTLQTKVTS
jgi:DNA-binding IclR family transcriptional regulator